MPTKRGQVWKLLRRALVWAGGGGALKRGLAAVNLRLLLDSIRSLRAGAPDRALLHGERQLSFDDTPVFRFRLGKRGGSFRRLLFPCIDPATDRFSDGAEGYDESKRFLCGGEAAGEEDRSEVGGEEGEKSVDERAEEFIARFYKQMKLQRQVSLLQYGEMMQRGLS